MSKGVLYLVATPIGNLEDVTFRAIRILGEVALIAAEDTRRTAKLLHRYEINTPTLSLHEHNEQRRTPAILSRLENGQSVALVTDAGTPLLSDPGAYLVKSTLAVGIHVEPIPGASAILSALVASGLTENQFTFIGFPPSRSNERKLWFQALKGEPRPMVLFESPHRIMRCLADMADILGDRQIAICREMTKAHEELVTGPISSVRGSLKSIKGEFTIVVAPQIDELIEASNEDIIKEFGHLTDTSTPRRATIKQIANKYGLSARSVYMILENNKYK
jgi:16S rRNA (cytidine1402-2'-O)-methyltransferase